TMFTLALVRFPPTATKEIQYLNAKGALTYTDIAGDPVLYGNLPPREISMKDVFRSGDSSKKFKIAEGQWYRYAPSYVSPAYRSEERRVGKECRSWWAADAYGKNSDVRSRQIGGFRCRGSFYVRE